MERLEPIFAPSSFVKVVGVTDPGQPVLGIPASVRINTHEDQNITIGRQVFRRALLQGAAALSTGTLTVANNNFAASAEIILGDYTLVSGVDYIPGVAVGNTATNIAAAINNLTDFTASALAAVVTINYGKIARVPFLVRHYGTVTNFTTTPTSGWLTPGGPSIGPPILT